MKSALRAIARSALRLTLGTINPDEAFLTNPLAKLIPARYRKSVPVIPVVRLKGMIADGGGRFQQTLSLASCAQALEQAFSDKRAPAVAIVVNSPGGSPVQSRLIYRRIRDLAEEKKKPVYVFTEDAAASGGYMIAVAGDEIVADPSSIVGSIGVISAGFGFVEAIDKLGIERRVYTAGKNKSTLDPFRPVNEDDIAHIKSLQLDIHEAFIGIVRERRGDKLSDDEELFTGRFWAGDKAKALGLVDHVGDMRSFLKKKFGPKTQMRLVTQPRGLFGRRQASGISLPRGLAESDISDVSAEASSGLLQALEERALWSRFGL